MKRTFLFNSSIAALFFSAAPCALADDGIGNEAPEQQLRSCASDVNGDAWIDFGDLTQILADWGACPRSDFGSEPVFCASDVNADGQVGWLDMLDVLANQGMSCDLILAAQGDDLGNQAPRSQGTDNGGPIETDVDPSGRGLGDGRDAGQGLSGGSFDNRAPRSQGVGHGGPIESAAGGDLGNQPPRSQGVGTAGPIQTDVDPSGGGLGDGRDAGQGLSGGSFDNRAPRSQGTGHGGPVEESAGGDLGRSAPRSQGTSHSGASHS